MPVVLLVHCDGTDGSTTFTDVSPSGHLLLSTGSAAVSTVTPKFGTGSVNFPSAAAWIAQNDALGKADWNFGSGQFTIEAWAYFTATPSSVHGVVTQFGASSNLGFFFGMVSGALNFHYAITGADNNIVGAAYSPTLNTWIHLAVDRDASNVLRVYANGVVIAFATVSATFFASTRDLFIGNDGNGNRGFPGKLDEIRITKGTAQYGGAFTPPTAPFGDTSARATQVAAEHWLITDPNAQITQVLLEHWASVTSDNLQAVVTQVVLEHWASVAEVVIPPPAAGGPLVTMIY